MSKKSGESNSKVVNLDAFRIAKRTIKIEIGEYYAHPEMGVFLHCIGTTVPMHTKNNEVHFVVEDHFGNLATFRTDDPPTGLVCSNINEFAAACVRVVESASNNPDDPEAS